MHAFKQKQLTFERVKAAYLEKERELIDSLKHFSLSLSGLSIFLRVFKQERRLEVWCRSGKVDRFRLFVTYPFTGYSGRLGPKKREGDRQIPEGFYTVDRFQPLSKYHLSLGLNYPNERDMRVNTPPRGGDIFIHGGDSSTGCIPIGDERIKELYVLAVEARNSGQEQIPVHIFPCRLTDNSLENLCRESSDSIHQRFWEDLKRGYDLFESSLELPLIRVSSGARYVVKHLPGSGK